MTYPTPNFSIDLTGQTALVTGASSGLGLRFAKTLAAAGAKVALCARRVEKLEQVCREIREAGGTAEPFALDVMDAQRCIAVVGEVEAKLGPVSILVNNAGIPDAQRAHKMSLELIDRVLDTNLRGPFVLSCEVARRLIDKGLPGRMVNISSVGAFSYGGNGAALYSITKAAIIRMTEALAVEWARLQHQRQRHRPRRLRLGDDGRHAAAHRRHHPGLPAQTAGRSGPARLHPAVPGLPIVRIRHRHLREGGRRPGEPVGTPSAAPSSSTVPKRTGEVADREAG